MNKALSSADQADSRWDVLWGWVSPTCIWRSCRGLLGQGCHGHGGDRQRGDGSSRRESRRGGCWMTVLRRRGHRGMCTMRLSYEAPLACWAQHISFGTSLAHTCLSPLWAIRWAETQPEPFFVPLTTTTTTSTTTTTKQCLVTGVHGGQRDE